MTGVLTRHGKDYRPITWVRLMPLASTVLRAAAEASATKDVKLTFHSPKRSSGRIQANENGTALAIASTARSVPAIRAMEEGAIGATGVATKTQFIAFTKANSTVAYRLRFAADLLDTGHDVLLWADDEDFHVVIDTSDCGCENCNPTTNTIK